MQIVRPASTRMLRGSGILDEDVALKIWDGGNWEMPLGTSEKKGQTCAASYGVGTEQRLRYRGARATST